MTNLQRIKYHLLRNLAWAGLATAVILTLGYVADSLIRDTLYGREVAFIYDSYPCPSDDSKQIHVASIDGMLRIISSECD